MFGYKKGAELPGEVVIWVCVVCILISAIPPLLNLSYTAFSLSVTMALPTDFLGSIINPTTIFLLVIIWFTSSTVNSWYRLRHIPGPFLASFSYLWLGYCALSGKQLEAVEHASKKYGSLIRVGPNELLTDDPEIIKSMSGVKSKYLKSEWYAGSRFNPYHQTMFETLNPTFHDKTKAQVAPGYSGRDSPCVEADVDAQVNSLTDLIRSKYITTPGVGGFRPLNLARTVSFFTLDIISKLSLGQSFGYIETETDGHGFHDILHKTMLLISITQHVPWIRRIAYSTIGLKIWGPKETDPKGVGKVMCLANDAVRNIFKPEADRGGDTILASFVRHGLTQAQCEVETVFMFVAGSDTTASATRITMLYILSTPRVYQRLKEEIVSAIKEGKVSSPITQAEARDLPYLQAVIYEGLRIRPVTSSIIAKEVPPGGDIINGKFIPAGTNIGTNFFALLNSKAVFGDDPEVFRPERFLEVDDKTFVEMQRHVDLTFGYGRWMCAGKNIAMMELNKVYFELLRYFDFQLLDPRRPMTTASHGLYIDVGLSVRVTEFSIDP
ncbi:cytochrome P450 [Jackrogersella minutella]|nr:cytochrome P450 [Jackrogersella minutella]